MLITNYGLFWERDLIHWGRGRSAGHLKGVLVGSKKSKAVDFREQQGVYCLYDETFRLVYVGQAGGKNKQRLFGRLKQHRDDAVSNRWSKFSWFGIRAVLGQGDLKKVKKNATINVSEVLNHIEAILIAAAEPVHNRQRGRFGDQVKQYRQFRDRDNLYPSTDKMIQDLWDDWDNTE
jgi:hypothetical protein